MSNQHHPILRTLYIPYDLDQFIKVSHMANNIRYPEALNQYLTLGIDKKIVDVRDFPKNFYSKSIAVPPKIDDIIISKAREYNTSYNNIFMEYLILGVNSVDTEDRLLKMWKDSLKKYLLELKSIYDLNTLQEKLDALLEEKSELEQDLIYVNKNIKSLNKVIEKQKNKSK